MVRDRSNLFGCVAVHDTRYRTSGAGAKSVLSSSSWMDTNRGEVLRALLVCLASTLYRAPAEDSKIEQRVLGMRAQTQARR